MTEDKLRLGGMALRNGLLVHGPTHWAAAVRTDDGEVKVASGRKPRFGAGPIERVPGLRGVAKLAEAMAVIPLVKKALPEARLPMQDPRTLAAMGDAKPAAQAVVDPAGVGLAARRHRDQDAERRLSAREVAGAVDRVDDPAIARQPIEYRSVGIGGFLAHDRQLGNLAQAFGQHVFRQLVGHGDDVVGLLGLDLVRRKGAIVG